MKRQVDYHEVIVKFVVRPREVQRAVDGYPAVRAIRGKRQQLAALVEAGIGKNDMNGLDVEDLEISIDGKAT